MNVPDNLETIQQRILRAIREDERIVGAVDYGSSSEGREDELSDIDMALYIQDDALEAFQTGWKEWVAQFGELLLAYIGGVGHPWVVYEGSPFPVRIDFNFHPASKTDNLLSWPNSPLSVEKMVLFDETDGELTKNVQKIVGQSLAPPDLQQAFEQVGGDFWYYLLRTYTKLLRGEEWTARSDFNFIIINNLMAMLRIESGSVERWRGSMSSARIEQVVTQKRLKQLEDCIPSVGADEVKRAMYEAARLGAEVSEAIVHQHRGWSWPRQLAERIKAILH